MTKHYSDYVWKGGIPYGINLSTSNPTTYKIVMDPYKKRISIEKYESLEFVRLIYDSALLDFRHLKPLEQTAWQKTPVKESPKSILSHIRNQDDRLLFFEECFFEGEYCRECYVTSPHGQLLSIHKMYYEALNDAFNGVILFDSNQHSVMQKKYSINETGTFDKLLHEHWDFDKAHALAPMSST